MKFRRITQNLIACFVLVAVFAQSGYAQDNAAKSAYNQFATKKKVGISGTHRKLVPNPKSSRFNETGKESGMEKAPGDTVYFEPFSFTTWPAEILRFNLDGKAPGNNPGSTVNTQLFGNNAWVTTTQAPSTNRFAASLSWTTAGGPVDRWMVTPPITLTEANKLRWTARASNPDFPDGYEVRICTNCPASITNANVTSSFSTVLFSIDQESSTGVFTSRELSLDSYSGQTVRLAFRNNSVDMDRLYIDNILIFKPNPFDVAAGGILSPDTSVYDCSKTHFPSVVSVTNSGTQNLYNVSVKLKSVGPIIDSVSMMVDSIVRGATDTLVFQDGLDLSAPGNYQLRLITSVTGDVTPANNQSSASFRTRAPQSGTFTFDFESLTSARPLPAGWFWTSRFLPFSEDGGFNGSQSLDIPVYNNLGTFGSAPVNSIITGKFANIPAGSTLSFKYKILALSTPEYALVAGDTVSITLLKNCIPADTILITSENQSVSSDYQKLFFPMDSLDLTATDQISLVFTAKASPTTSVYLFDIDDLELGTVLDNDISLVNLAIPPFSIIKKNQFSSFSVKGAVFNEGTTTVSPVRITAVAAPSTLQDTARISTLPGGFSKPFSTTPGFNLSESGDYTIEVTAAGGGPADPAADNNTISFPITISDSTIAKDFGDPINDVGLGYGATVGGKRIMANVISTTARDTLTSVSIFTGTLDVPCRARAFFGFRNTAGTLWLEDSSTTIVDIPTDQSNTWVNLRFRRNTTGGDRGRAVSPNTTNMYGVKIRQGNLRICFNDENTSDDGSIIWLGGQWTGTQDLTVGAITFFIRPNFGRPSTLVSASQLEQSLRYAEIIPNPTSGNARLSIQLNKNKEIGVQILSMEGRMISEDVRYGFVGNNRLELPTQGLQKGIYLVRVIADDYSTTRKLVME